MSLPGSRPLRREARALNLTALVALSAACSANSTSYTSDADHGSTQSLVAIERRETLGSPGAQAQAFASFVRTPPEVDLSVVTRLTGLDLGLPELGECSAGNGSARDPSVPLSPLRRVELLDAGDVALETPGGRVALAPRAFPAVTDLLAGVVYTTRDQTAELPASASYELSVAGSAELPALVLRADAPAPVQGLTLDGVPLAPSARLAPGSVLRWEPGAPRDLVYIALTSAESERTILCTFRDSAGQGVLRSPMLPPPGSATLSVHRLRSIPLGSGVGTGELRFDFEQLVSIEVAGAE